MILIAKNVHVDVCNVNSLAVRELSGDKPGFQILGTKILGVDGDCAVDSFSFQATDVRRTIDLADDELGIDLTISYRSTYTGEVEVQFLLEK